MTEGAGPPLNVGDPPTGLSYFYGSHSTHDHWAAASSLCSVCVCVCVQ